MNTGASAVSESSQNQHAQLDYQIFPALHEESNSGWVWLSTPGDLKSRTHIWITNPKKRKSVCCACRILDAHFQRLYNDRANAACTRQLTSLDRALVISDWYRSHLEIEPSAETATLEVKPHGLPVLDSIQAGWNHPDPIVRLATFLGVISVCLGFLSLGLAISSLFWPGRGVAAANLAFILLLVAFLSNLFPRTRGHGA